MFQDIDSLFLTYISITENNATKLQGWNGRRKMVKI